MLGSERRLERHRIPQHLEVHFDRRPILVLLCPTFYCDAGDDVELWVAIWRDCRCVARHGGRWAQTAAARARRGPAGVWTDWLVISRLITHRCLLGL